MPKREEFRSSMKTNSFIRAAGNAGYLGIPNDEFKSDVLRVVTESARLGDPIPAWRASLNRRITGITSNRIEEVIADATKELDIVFETPHMDAISNCISSLKQLHAELKDAEEFDETKEKLR